MASEAPAQLDGQPQPAANPEQPDNGQKTPVKRSWRRKYRKMRARFAEVMTASDNLIRDEYRAVALARRLQEQNDQILDMLVDMNETPRMSVSRRFDLRSPSPAESVLPSLEVEADPEAISRKMNELRKDLADNVISAEEFARRSEQLNSAQAIPLMKSLANLEAKTPHTTEVPDPAPEGLILGEDAPGYMSPKHEEEWLLALDAALIEPTYDPADGRPIRLPSSHTIPNEKELSLHNPDSVYNWLRKHQPQVFLQDKEGGHHENLSEKSSAKPANSGRGGGKRQSAVSGSTPGPKTDPEALDEDLGFVEESGTASGKGRRGTKEDDGAYRPKGGSSRGKRKREDGEPTQKGGRKKNRTSNVAAA